MCACGAGRATLARGRRPGHRARCPPAGRRRVCRGCDRILPSGGAALSAFEERALAALDADALAADASELVRVPSVTGDERAVLERFGGLARARGLVARTRVHDLSALRADPAYPGEEAARSELFGVTAVLRGRNADARRLCLNGHLDVVAPGTERSARDPWSGELADGRLHGRGAVDMKGAVAAALHALVAVGAAG